jgi:hypothetical protein
LGAMGIGRHGHRGAWPSGGIGQWTLTEFYDAYTHAGNTHKVPHLECVSMGCLNWRESRAEGRAEQKSSDLIPVQARDWLSRKRNTVRPPVSPVPAKPISKEGMLEGRLDPHVPVPVAHGNALLLLMMNFGPSPWPVCTWTKFKKCQILHHGIFTESQIMSNKKKWLPQFAVQRNLK